jgi:hypothetical protein|tara:strand:+ start:5699 stop:5950 length:252 start_codon:yes stop_codon:yes gene_type:complete
MNTEVDYSDFNLTIHKKIDVGRHFLWSGQLYQRIEPTWQSTKDPDSNQEYLFKNVIKVESGELFYFFDEEPVVPVTLNIKVTQ